MAGVDARYPALLRQREDEAQQSKHLRSKGHRPPDAEPTPSELAYTQSCKDEGGFPKHGLAITGQQAFRMEKRSFPFLRNHVGSEDFEAEIDRLFPTPRRS
jgi:hypothetical protein